MPSPIPEATRAAVLADIETSQKSRGAIARDHGVSTTTVSKIARDAGIEQPFSREQTKSATEAALADHRARRADEASGSISAATHLRENLLKSESGRDAQGWATAYGIMIDKHAMLDGYDSDNGVAGAKSLLSGLGDALASLSERAERRAPVEE